MRGIVRSFALIFPLLIVEGLGQTLSNEQVVVSTVKDAASRELGDLQNHRIVVVTDGSYLNGLIAGALAEVVRGKSAEVMLASQPDSSAENLIYKIQNFEFKYKKGSSRGFFRQHRVKREFQGEMNLALQDGASGKIISAHNIPLSYEDQVDPGMLASLKSNDIPELSPRPPGTPVSKFIKPALVVASVSVLVYLFFANR